MIRIDAAHEPLGAGTHVHRRGAQPELIGAGGAHADQPLCRPLPYYRQETINARSDVHTQRSTLASQSGKAGAAMQPLYEAHKRFVLSCPVLHADETPVAMLDPGAGAHAWAYARGELDAQRGVIYEFCLGPGSQYPRVFLGAAQGPPGSTMEDQPAWQGTLVCDQYAGYDAVLDSGCNPNAIHFCDEVRRHTANPCRARVAR